MRDSNSALLLTGMILLIPFLINFFRARRKIASRSISEQASMVFGHDQAGRWPEGVSGIFVVFFFGYICTQMELGLVWKHMSELLNSHTKIQLI